MADWEMVDYFTSAVTSKYLVALREEFEIPNDVELMVPGPNDIPSRLPPDYITLYAEFFRARLRLLFHPYLRQALHRLNVAPMQLNANIYRILISCFVLWTKNYTAKLPYKHLSFFTAGWWLHGHLPYGEVPPGERVPITFRRGYVWTRGPHTDARILARIDALREKADPERNQNRLLSALSLAKYNWFGLSSTSDYPHDRPRAVLPGEVIVTSRMPDPVVHYRARTVVTAEVVTTSGQFEVLRGVPVASTHGLQSDSSSLNLLCSSGDHTGTSVLATRTGLPDSNKSSPKPAMVVKVEQEPLPLFWLARPLSTLLKPGQVARERSNQSPLCLPPGVVKKTLGLTIPPP
ncbi:hypothetical protein TIFTF001_017477 [Ficus carica]|uniref:Uncharacterized protein n=1 Tax=Ficus carica TaxID=3494 RepID=A0AA88D9S4_FICCA|nr:hypothetical protein TIFTF001_017477 [Ficus carica]